MKKKLSYQLIIFLVMPFILSWPAWFNGQPFLFPDTTAYIKGAASAFNLVWKTNEAADWLAPKSIPITVPNAPSTAPVTTPAAPQFSSSPDKSGVIAGRSIYYGFFVFATAALFGLKFVPLLQALLSTILITSILRVRFLIDYKIISIALFLLAIASPLPFFNSMLMPDVFAGLGIAAAISLILMPNATSSCRIFWALLVLLAGLFHTGNILIILATIVSLVVLSLLVDRRVAPKPTAVLLALAMVAIGIGGEALFSYSVKHFTNSPPIRPPFMTARLLADGPGNDFVKNYCANKEFEVCNYSRDFSKATSDDFLWSLNPAIGVFTLAPKSARIQLGVQDFSFAKAVFLHYPVDVIKNTFKNVAEQIGYIGLEEYIYTPVEVRSFGQKIPAGEQNTLEATRAAKGQFDVTLSEIIIKLVSIGALLICLTALVHNFKRKNWSNFTWIMIFLLSILINAGVCGALSTPHDRYQARIIWILELMAFVIVAVRWNVISLANLRQPSGAAVGRSLTASAAAGATLLNTSEHE